MTSFWWRFHNSRLISINRQAAQRVPRRVHSKEDIYLTGNDLKRWEAGSGTLNREVVQAAAKLIKAGAQEVLIRRTGKISPLCTIMKADVEPHAPG